MFRDSFNRNQGRRDDRERYAADERDMNWNRDYSGYAPQFGDESRRQASRESWESGRNDFRGPWARRDEQDERPRGRMGEGFYDPGDEYAQTGFRQAGYREYPGRGAWEPNRNEPQDAGRYREHYGHARWNEPTGARQEYGRQPGYGAEQSFGARDSFQRQFERSQPDAQYPRYGSQAPHTVRERFEQQRSHFGRGPRGYKRSDDRIREDVNDRFYQDHEIDASEIEVRVSEGMVTLEGTVENRYIKRLAEDVAESVLGVTDVTNHLRVKRDEEGASAAAGGVSDNGGQKSRSGPTIRS